MRKAGILLPVFALSGGYGIGSFGKAAYDFVDFLAAAGQRIWQILPLSPTGYGDSPYQSCSAFAGSPYYIDLAALCEQKLLTVAECEAYAWGSDPHRVDYAALYAGRFGLLRTAHARFLRTGQDGFAAFCAQQAFWLNDYALYCAAKGQNGEKPWQQWAEPLRLRDPLALAALPASEVAFWKFLQFVFWQQWQQLKGYANQKGVEILGDLPIYVAADSADAWAGGALFERGENACVAGCPPDYFSPKGQLWGNPLYDWGYHKQTGYAWWESRLRHAMQLYNTVRIDHFRAFDSYYAIPATHTDACNGEWRQGVGAEFFAILQQRLGALPIVAEDLGLLFDSVRQLVRQTGFSGMKVLQFAFGGDAHNEYLPHNHIKNCVVYTGTHDNDTTASWLAGLPPHELAFATRYMGLNEGEGMVQGVVRTALASCAERAIVPLADWLCLGAEGRINTPGTQGGNWSFRLAQDALTPALAAHIRSQCACFGRA